MDPLRVHTEKITAMRHRLAAKRIPMLEYPRCETLRDTTFYSVSFILLQVTRESRDIVENGLSVYNPVLVGSLSYVLIPQIYGAFDAFSILLVFLGTILRYIFQYFHVSL